MRRRPIRGLLLLLLPALLIGCGRTINRTAERKIRDALPGYIGPARIWRAHVDSPADSTLKGYLKSVTIDGEDVQLRQTIVCDSLHVEMRDALVDTGKQNLKAVGLTTFTAVIGERSLNEYLLRAKPPEDDPIRLKRVDLRRDSLTIDATRYLLGHDWPFTITVEPRLTSDTRLTFDPARMSVLGLRLPLPRTTLRWLARHMDTGFDFSTLPFPVHIARFAVEDGRVTLAGTADVMRSLNERIAMGGFRAVR